MIKYNLVILLILITVSNVFAFPVTFSWIANTEFNLDRYEIYCDPLSNIERGTAHTYTRVADKDNIINGRVMYTWEDFPSESQYCCAVAIDSDGLVSDFSKELYVDAASGFFGPKNFNFKDK